MLQCSCWQCVVAVQFCALAVLVIMAWALWRTSRRPSCDRVLCAIPCGWRLFLGSNNSVIAEQCLVLTTLKVEVRANISGLQIDCNGCGVALKV